jgi:hypothetical protein
LPFARVFSHWELEWKKNCGTTNEPSSIFSFLIELSAFGWLVYDIIILRLALIIIFVGASLADA